MISAASKNYIGVGIMALGIFILYAFGWNYYSNMGEYSVAIEENILVLQQREKTLEDISRLDALYQEKKQSLEKLVVLIPQKDQAAEMVSSISEIANATGLQISQLLVAASKRPLKTGPYTLHIELETSGNYLSALALLNKIEDNIRIIDVSDISLSKEKSGQGILINLKMDAYFVPQNATIN